MNPYSILGVQPGCDLNAAKAAYRRLAKTCHPDLRPGDQAAADKFRDITRAYEALRARGRPGEPALHAARTPKRAPAQRGGDRRSIVRLTLVEAITGAVRPITFPDGASLDVICPAGLEDGAVLLIPGAGRPGRDGGQPGDARVDVRILPDPVFRLDNADIHVRLIVTPGTLAHGGIVEAPTPTGRVRLNVPRGARPGQTLRLRGQGLPERGERAAGDLYASLAIGAASGTAPDMAHQESTAA